jgi:hypothetical protein
MHGNMNIKFINAKQVKEIHQYRNTREKLYKTNAAIWHNKVCTGKHLPVPNVQQKTPDDGQRRCPKHVKFYNRLKLG